VPHEAPAAKALTCACQAGPGTPGHYAAGMPELPWECVVLGIPVSVNGRNKARKQKWREDVQAAAHAEWPDGEALLACELEIHISYFHDSASMDVDNMIKPIQDALNGIIYVDDKQLTDTHGHRRDLNDRYRLRGLTPALAKGFMTDAPFVHIRIEAPSSTGRLP
jgi:crossover junction endodeoxyribonuclease RusA